MGLDVGYQHVLVSLSLSIQAHALLLFAWPDWFPCSDPFCITVKTLPHLVAVLRMDSLFIGGWCINKISQYMQYLERVNVSWRGEYSVTLMWTSQHSVLHLTLRWYSGEKIEHSLLALLVSTYSATLHYLCLCICECLFSLCVKIALWIALSAATSQIVEQVKERGQDRENKGDKKDVSTASTVSHPLSWRVVN